ncbi:hypothetical protein [Tianweitania sediminis]|uniref:Uncharacterized protein n=1 Tax=Tianweitania sediminis TaxID=1502156 RepID=A0A8J7UK08_9HYPH|nr:hypothetical protein [Tianweitania sediminis]MBP0439395.1 hypothetical protein [Tianweitania sediminis]
MAIEIDLSHTAEAAEPCSFTIWLPLESNDVLERRRSVALAEDVMTTLPAMLEIETQRPGACTFLRGQWL